MITWVTLDEFKLSLPDDLESDEEPKAFFQLQLATGVAQFETNDRNWTDESCPFAVKDVIIAGVKRRWLNPGSLASEVIGNVENAYQPTTLNLFTQGELDVLRRYRVGKGVTSVAMTHGEWGNNDIYVDVEGMSYPIAWESA